MTKKEQKYYERACKCLTEEFGKNLSLEKLEIHDGDTSVILNPKFKYKEFLGHSVWGIIDYVARIQNKKTIWV